MGLIEEYLAFVWSTKTEDRLWWYTSLSSRNRFQSPLFSHFEKLKFGNSRSAESLRFNGSFILRYLLLEFIKVSLCWLFFFSKRKKANPEVIFKSFVYPKDLNCEADSYWGYWPKIMSEERRVLRVVCLIGFSAKNFFQSLNQDFIPVHAFISPLDFFKSLKKLILYYLNCKHPNGLIESLLKKEVFNNSFFYAILVEQAFINITKSYSLEAVLLTFEGNAWERGLVYGLKSVSDIPVYGYVHTVVPEISTNLFSTKDECDSGFLPDKVLVLGRAPLEIISIRSGWKSHQLIEFCALRFEKLMHFKPAAYSKSKRCLVLLEGVPQVTQILALVFETASKMNDWTFELRFHPALGWDKIRTKFNFKMPVNVIVSSNESLYDSIYESFTCIYWGSTAGIEALYLGRPIIHVDIGTSLSYDPLFEHKGLHYNVQDSYSLVQTLRFLFGLSTVERDQLQIESSKYLSNYFTHKTHTEIREVQKMILSDRGWSKK